MHLFFLNLHCTPGSVMLALESSDALATIVQLLCRPSSLRCFIHLLLIAGTQDAVPQVPFAAGTHSADVQGSVSVGD